MGRLSPISPPAWVASGVLSKRRAWRKSSVRRLGSHGFATKSTAPKVRAWRALLSSLWPERTMIFMSGDSASRSPIRANPSSGRCGRGGRPRSTRASGGSCLSCRSTLKACALEWLVITSYSFANAKLSDSLMSESSSTINKSGLADGKSATFHMKFV